MKCEAKTQWLYISLSDSCGERRSFSIQYENTHHWIAKHTTTSHVLHSKLQMLATLFISLLPPTMSHGKKTVKPTNIMFYFTRLSFQTVKLHRKNITLWKTQFMEKIGEDILLRYFSNFHKHSNTLTHAGIFSKHIHTFVQTFWSVLYDRRFTQCANMHFNVWNNFHWFVPKISLHIILVLFDWNANTRNRFSFNGFSGFLKKLGLNAYQIHVRIFCFMRSVYVRSVLQSLVQTSKKQSELTVSVW